MLGFPSFAAFYESPIQGVYLLWVVPLFFLAYLVLGPKPDGSRAVLPSALPFLRVYALFFAIETIVDPFATGPLLRALGLVGGAGTAVMVFFVLVGDFRVFLWVLRLSRAGATNGAVAGEAAAWTLVVPLTAVTVNVLLEAVLGALPAQSIWLVYELSFAALGIYFRFRWLPDRVPDSALLDYLEDVVEWVIGYYLLWAAADVLILFVGADFGWALRVVPNQLYYSFYLPFVYARFFAAARETDR